MRCLDARDEAISRRANGHLQVSAGRVGLLAQRCDLLPVTDAILAESFLIARVAR